MKYLEYHYSEGFALTVKAIALTIVGFSVGFVITLAVIATHFGMVRW